MEPNTITITSSIIESLGIGTFVYFLIKGLNTKIKALEGTISVQKDTLAAMEERVNEVKKFSEVYANFAEELPKYIENYEKIVCLSKDRAISHLESEVMFYEKKIGKYESILLNSSDVLSNKEVEPTVETPPNEA
jgi:DNA repair ATPase RecN